MGAQIAAAAGGLMPPLAAACVAEVAESPFEQELEATAGEEGLEATTAGRGTLLKGGVTAAVVGSALPHILQDVVGLIHLLELGFGRLVALVVVGMVPHRQAAIGLLQVVL